MSDAPSAADLGPDALDLLRNSRLVQVRTTRLDAELVDDSVPVENVTFQQEVECADNEGRFFGRYTFTLDLISAAGDNAARLSCTIVAQWLLADGYRVQDRAVRDYVAATVGYMAVYPYARAILHQQAAELAVGSLVLGTVEVGQYRPSTITLNGVMLGSTDSSGDDVSLSYTSEEPSTD